MLCMLMAMVDSPEDKRKVEKLYEMYNSLMYSVAYGVLNHVQDAEDAGRCSQVLGEDHRASGKNK